MSTQMMTVEQTQEALGHIGRSTLWRITKSGELATVKIGKRRMYLTDSVDSYIRRRLEGGSGVAS